MGARWREAAGLWLIALSLISLNVRIDRLETGMRAGNMDRRVLIQSLTVTRGATGEEKQSWGPWTDVVSDGKVWAEILPVKGGESFQTDRRVNRQELTLRIRYLPGLTSKHRIVHDGETFEITDVAEPKRRQELVLTCYALDVTSGP